MNEKPTKQKYRRPLFTSYNIDENTYKKCVLFSAQFQGNSHSLTPSPPPQKKKIFR